MVKVTVSRSLCHSVIVRCKFSLLRIPCCSLYIVYLWHRDWHHDRYTIYKEQQEIRSNERYACDHDTMNNVTVTPWPWHRDTVTVTPWHRETQWPWPWHRDRDTVTVTPWPWHRGHYTVHREITEDQKQWKIWMWPWQNYRDRYTI